MRWGSDALFIEAFQGSVLVDEHSRRTVEG